MTSDGPLWDYMRKKLGPYGRFTRIENSCGIGTPDIAYTIRVPRDPLSRGVSGWIELKYLPLLPMRQDTPVHVPSLQLAQVQWLEDEAKAGGRAWVLLQAGKIYVLLNPAVTRDLYERRLTTKDLQAAATCSWRPPLFPLAPLCLALST
jgi:hypothetical protein